MMAHISACPNQDHLRIKLIWEILFDPLRGLLMALSEISGMPTSLKRVPPQTMVSPHAMGEPSSSSGIRGDGADSSQVL
ncbi:hypothetical protein BVC80_9077g75 [Macleaya cordata]|uniref:Uncharacterized protein n=1 Tax=Macleaya cordata TaxID=56857 RepID=A0A200PLQ7_MACCD|nr:hypothetical protein BVC80_9077g75 [Macleaya cordata]